MIKGIVTLNTGVTNTCNLTTAGVSNKNTAEYRDKRYDKLISINKGRFLTHNEHLELSMLMNNKETNMFTSIIATNEENK